MATDPVVDDRLKARESDSAFGFQPFLRAGYGALLGIAPLIASVLMHPSHRSPYLLAYPAVVLSAWVWGMPASVACAAVSGGLIEYFIFQTGQITLSPAPSGGVFRAVLFLGGSVLVGGLTRSTARQRQNAATADLNQRLLLAEAETAVANEKAIANELALENQVRSQMALDGARVGLWEWDIASQKSKWSRGYYQLHGLDPNQNPAETATYDLWRRCVYPDDVERVESAIRRAIAEHSSFQEEYRILLPNGVVRWISCQGTAITNSDGEVVRISGFGGDVTRRKLADLALLQNEKMIIAGRLIATIAHEINNPLDAAMNILYLLRSGVPEEEQHAFIEDASTQLERIAQISRQTLNFSRSSVRATLIRPSALVDDSLRLLNPKLRLAGIEVSTEVRGDTEFLCERREAQQILINILNNAIEATVNGGRLRIRITDSVEWRHRRKPGVRITIADTGRGMARDVISHIAEPFFTTREGVGTGLGMWVVHELLRMQGGAISISSSTAESHHGTVVSLFIPFAIDTAHPPDTPAADREAGSLTRVL